MIGWKIFQRLRPTDNSDVSSPRADYEADYHQSRSSLLNSQLTDIVRHYSNQRKNNDLNVHPLFAVGVLIKYPVLAKLIENHIHKGTNT